MRSRYNHSRQRKLPVKAIKRVKCKIDISAWHKLSERNWMHEHFYIGRINFWW